MRKTNFPFCTTLWHLLGAGSCSSTLSSMATVRSGWVLNHSHRRVAKEKPGKKQKNV